MTLRLTLNRSGTLTVELPGPTGSSKTLELSYARPELETVFGSAQATNSETLLKLIELLEAQARAGEIRPWMDASKPPPTVTKLEARAKVRTPVDPLTPQRRAELGWDKPRVATSLAELFEEDEL